ncbi:vacuolar protein sorting-associated protein 28 homolog isoform X4 [Camelus dromedarius]
MERIREDRPITIKDDKGNLNRCIADVVSLFITVMDKLRLEIRAMDEIQPDLRELMETMHRMSHLPPDFEGRQTVNQWERRYPGCRERAHQIPGMDCAGLDAARVSLGLSTWGSEELMLQHGPLGSQGSEVIRGACCARSWTSKAGVPERRVKAGVSYPGCQEFCPRCRTGTSVFGGCGKKHEHRS